MSTASPTFTGDVINSKSSDATIEEKQPPHYVEQGGKVLNADEILLAKLGYKQNLSRSMGYLSNMFITISCMSILTSVVPLFDVTVSSGGPVTLVWGWLLVAVCTFCVGLNLAEICSAFPTTGGLYYWTSRLAKGEHVPLMCWVVGYFNWLGLSVAITSIDLGAAQVVTSIAMITNPDLNLSTYHTFGIFVGILVLHGILNSLSIRINAWLNTVAAWWYIIGVLLIVIISLALTPNKPSAQRVLTDQQNETGFPYGWGFMLGLLAAQYTISGYDTAAHMAEETQGAQEGSPKGIVYSIAAVSILGLIFGIAMAFCIQDYEAQIINYSAGMAMAQIWLDGVGPALTIFFLVITFVGSFFSGSSLVLGSTRMVYAFARDGAMPFSKYLHTLHPTTRAPMYACWFNIMFAFVIGCLYLIPNPTVYSAIVSVNTIASNASYFIPIYLRMTSGRMNFVPGPFNLGKFTYVIGFISCSWILVTTALFLAPTSAPVTVDNMNWAFAPFVAVIGLAMGYFALDGRKWFKGPIREVDEDGIDVHKPVVEDVDHDGVDQFNAQGGEKVYEAQVENANL